MTTFNLLRSDDRRTFLHVHTPQTTFIVELDCADGDLDKAREAITGPPIPFSGKIDQENTNQEDTEE